LSPIWELVQINSSYARKHRVTPKPPNIKDLQKITFHFLGEILAFGISVIFGV